MILRGIDFGNVLAASGVQGFFGEGYWYHRLWRPFGLDFTDVTFVSKTATFRPRSGNMPLTKSYTPRELFPSCVRVKFWKGLVLNSVGLSNPGLTVLLDQSRWQSRDRPFMISVMAVADNPADRPMELRWIVEALGDEYFRSRFGIQVNLSCPNTGHDPKDLIREASSMLSIAGRLGVPVMAKFSIDSAPIEAILELQDDPNCDAICVSNAPKFGWEGIDWQRTWGSTTSPIAHLGGGGLSGGALCPLVCEWIARLREAGFTKPINGGGGILSSSDVLDYQQAGASSVFLGSVAILRPWRVRGIVQTANSLNWYRSP